MISTLTLSYTGTTKYNDWNIRSVRVKVPPYNGKVFSNLKSSPTERCFSFVTDQKFDNSAISSIQPRLYFLAEEGRKLSLSARLYKIVEPANGEDRPRVEKMDLPVAIESMPTFKVGKLYRLIITNGESLKAMVVELDDREEENNASSALLQIGNPQVQSDEEELSPLVDKDFDVLGIRELKALLVTIREKLASAKLELEQAYCTGDENTTRSAERKKQLLQMAETNIVRALNLKGDQEKSQESLIHCNTQ